MATPYPDYLKAAAQRLEAAAKLIELRYTLDGMYLAGYAVECSLKALILHLTPDPERAAMFARIGSGASMHQPETLRAILRADCGTDIPNELVKRYRRFGWATELRYATGRADYGEARGTWKTGRLVYEWVLKEMT